jgi:outer membrane protein assembly factor BamB
MDRRTQRELKVRQRRRRTAVVAGGLSVVVVVLVVSLSSGSTPSSHPASSTSTTVPAAQHAARSATSSGGPVSLEAGVAPWQLPVALSRASLVPTGSGFTLLGGLTSSQASVSTVYGVDPVSGRVVSDGTLAHAVHDAAAGAIGSQDLVFGGGSPDTVATVQSIASSGAPTPSSAPPPPRTGTDVGQLPTPRSDLSVVTVPGAHGGTTTLVAGGYDGTTYLPDVLATKDGVHFATVAHLSVPVRYAAAVDDGGLLYLFGGQTPSAGTTTAATDDIQVVDPAAHTSKVVAHLPQPLYGAASFVIDGTIYVAGGQVPGGPTLTTIDAFVPSSGKVLNAGLLPQAEAFGAYATVGSAKSAVGYIAGGEVASQTGPDQAGIASGTLQTVISLRPSPYGGRAGVPGAGAPYAGTLLIADRGNNRLIALDPSRNQTWAYPSASMPPPPGGFYFPDDSFFIHHGTGIISNQEDNHTIVEIGYPSGKLLWQYGHPLKSGSAPGYLNQPDDAYLLKDGTVTVADASNNRILFISPAGQPTGQIGNGAAAHDPPTSIDYPNGDTPLSDGNLLVSEINGSWVDEYTLAGKLVWTVHIPSVVYPSDPQQLGPDLYLMTDYNPPGEGKVLEFTRAGATPWVYDVTAGDAMLKKPSLAERLPNGMVMVNDDYRNRIVVIDPATNSIVWQYGITDQSGTVPGMLSIPDGFDNLLADGTTPTHPLTG